MTNWIATGETVVMGFDRYSFDVAWSFRQRGWIRRLFTEAFQHDYPLGGLGGPCNPLAEFAVTCSCVMLLILMVGMIWLLFSDRGGCS